MFADMKDKITQYAKELTDTLVVASLNYDIWWVYREKNNREQYLDILKRYPRFFQTSIHAHFAALVIALYRLFDCSSTCNIPDLFKSLTDENALEPNTLNRIEENLSEAKRLWKKITIIRNNVFAHRSNEYSVEEFFKKAHITPDEMKRLMELSNILINDITNITYFNDLSATEDTKRLLDDLKIIKK